MRRQRPVLTTAEKGILDRRKADQAHHQWLRKFDEKKYYRFKESEKWDEARRTGTEKEWAPFGPERTAKVFASYR